MPTASILSSMAGGSSALSARVRRRTCAARPTGALTNQKSPVYIIPSAIALSGEAIELARNRRKSLKCLMRENLTPDQSSDCAGLNCSVEKSGLVAYWIYVVHETQHIGHREITHC